MWGRAGGGRAGLITFTVQIENAPGPHQFLFIVRQKSQNVMAESGAPSRAAAAARRRISASAARRTTASEVLLLTSKSFPSQQYQQLLNFIKQLQLPPDVSSLFTTVRNERVAERKALLSSHSQEDVVRATA